MRWPDDLTGWPNAAYSRRIQGPVHRWHVQEAGSGETILLLHGAGGATHTWRGVFEMLAKHHHVVAVDLPGHGFTQVGSRSRSGLHAMAQDLHDLMVQEGWTPSITVGHSAGGAIALQMALNGHTRQVITLNAALSSFKGIAGVLFPAIARILATAPFAPQVLSRMTGTETQVQALIRNTGSTLNTSGIALYTKLVADPDHVAGTLRMMAQWDLERLRDQLCEITVPVLLLTSENDKTVPPDISQDAARRIPDAAHASLGQLGHLAHEEAPGDVAAWINHQISGQNADNSAP